MQTASPRRVIVGTNARGQSAVFSDATVALRADRPNGGEAYQLWSQDVLPSPTDYDGASHTEMFALPPAEGAVVRTYTIQPEASESFSEAVGLHTSGALFVITVISGRMRVDLEVEPVELGPSETIVIRGNMHDLRNPFDEPVSLVYTAFRLTD
ncbi:hypothetical protein ACFVKB_38380 [Rhodococcus sp. NPDC127530]|uniref:hypothetical protein n=1 Tax=unclassified Rhodococcus (in: high G+C Gram-positive bacteria) TaxID=192944 RepID=UPI00362EF4F1